jgi:hypothetical protein
VVGVKPHVFASFEDRHGGMRGQQLDHHARMGGIEMLDPDESHAALGGKRREEGPKSVKPAGGGPIATTGKVASPLAIPRFCSRGCMTRRRRITSPLVSPWAARDNLAYGRPDASAEEIEEAARLASIHPMIMSLSQGYDTVIGEAGATLSEGEAAPEHRARPSARRSDSHPG